MMIPKGTLSPPPGRPSWGGGEELPLLYLGWGQRDFEKDPLAFHYDLGTNYYLVLRGEVIVTTGNESHTVKGPVAMLFDPDCAFGISQLKRTAVEILVWIWQGRPVLPELRPEEGGYLALELRPGSVAALTELHSRCRNEVALADGQLPRALAALRELLEIEISRSSQTAPAVDEMRWKLAHAWMAGNLAIHAPVPALCDYLRMSPSTLHRFFRAQTGLSPGAYFRRIKSEEARRLIREEGWQVKAVAYHLGYRHPNDLSRALASLKA
ncbi:helix-turn-helix transcriptional regulator [Luteolibacter yonseiensis]|uniref:Helix-turn-helix transcriptional regulator n=1 Tax=Luteolibacter yonseiensis TaxID=1144680 RepID=A0A934R940_9BACT|nr:helix-turn-helix transcriptional regulator [Luteolibacter yonseiensis]MBK1817740.1 helix-turn-helix transcriptional regulator [Luteolibacter yonseiensis]